MPLLLADLPALLGPFVRYCTVGVGNTVLDFGIYIGLTRGWEFWRAHFLVANAVAFAIVISWSFYWNKRWTFRNRAAAHRTQFVKFVTITLGGIAIAEAALFVGVRVFSTPDLLAKVFAGPLVMLWNFLAYRYWAFAERQSEPASELAVAVE